MTYQVTKPTAFLAKYLAENDVLNDGTWLWRVEHVKAGLDGVVRTVVVRVGEGGRACLDFPEDATVKVALDYEWVATEPHYKVAA